MEQRLDVARIKQYNKELREYIDKNAQVRAEYELSLKELNRVCEELSVELNIQVTPNNIEEVYNTYANNINNILATGEEILSRIKADEEQQRDGYRAPSVQSGQEVQSGQAVQMDTTSGVRVDNGFTGTLGSQVQQQGQPVQQAQTLGQIQSAMGGNPFMRAARENQPTVDIAKMVEGANFDSEFGDYMEPVDVVTEPELERYNIELND